MTTDARKSAWSGLLATLIVCGSLTACGAAAPQPAASPDFAPAAEAPMMERSAPAGNLAASDSAAVTERLIVRNADMTLVVDDVPARMEAAAAVAAKHDGFVVSSAVSRYDGEIRGNVTLRVKSEKLDAALADLRQLAVEVRAESSSGEDVTGEFVDLGAQLKNLESAEARLQKIMDEAKNTEDVLNVFNQLTQIRGQIEQIKGRMKFLSESAALSRISVEMLSDAASQPVEAPAWRPLGTAKTALDTLVTLLRGLADFLIYFVIGILPVLVLIIAPIVLIIRAVSRAARKRKLTGIAASPAPQVGEETKQ
jgi:hypothetical protein